MYRYYASKDALFAAVVTPALAKRFEALLEERVRALVHMALGKSPGQADGRGEEMLRFRGFAAWMDSQSRG